MYPLTTRLGAGRGYSPERVWEPLSDDEWAVLSPVLHRAAEREAERRRAAEIHGRPRPTSPALREPAARPAGPSASRGQRLDAVFWLAAHTLPGPRPRPPGPRFRPSSASPTPSPASSAAGPSRASGPSFLQALADAHYPGLAILRRLESWVCRAFRRAWRLLGRGRHGPGPAPRLPFRRCAAPPGCCPTPICPNRSFPSSRAAMLRAREHGLRILPPGFLRSYKKLLAIAARRRSIPRALAPP